MDEKYVDSSEIHLCDISNSDPIEKTIPSGIKFFFPCSHSLFNWDSISLHFGKDPVIAEYLSSIKVSNTFLIYPDMDFYCNYNFKKITSCLFKLLSCCDDIEMLQAIESQLLVILNQKSNCADTILTLFPDSIANIGGSCSKIFTNKEVSNLNSLTPAHVPINFIPLVNVLNKACMVCERSSSQVNKVDKLIVLLLACSLDQGFFSHPNKYVVTCTLTALLEIYPEDSFLCRMSQLVDDEIIPYIDGPEGLRDHKNSAFLCTDLLPSTKRGQTLRATYSYFCIQQMLSKYGEIDILPSVTVFEVCKYCEEQSNYFTYIDCCEAISLLTLIDASIKRPLKIGKEKKCLAALLRLLQSFVGGIRSEDFINKAILGSSFASLKKDWERLLNEKQYEENYSETMQYELRTTDNDDST